MSDYEVFDKFIELRKPFSIPGATDELETDIRNAISEGVPYGTYMWRKQQREDEEYFKKYGKKRRR